MSQGIELIEFTRGTDLIYVNPINVAAIRRDLVSPRATIIQFVGSAKNRLTVNGTVAETLARLSPR